jgi:hypothetical protein
MSFSGKQIGSCGQRLGCALLVWVATADSLRGADWVDFASTTGKFTASFPGQPTYKVDESVYVCVSDATRNTFEVTWKDWSEAEAQAIAQHGGVSEAIKAAADMTGVTVVAKKEVEVRGFPAWEYEVLKDGNKSTQRFVAVGQRLYAFTVRGSEGNLHAADRDKFLASVVPGVIPKSGQSGWIVARSSSGPFVAEYPAEPRLSGNEVVRFLKTETSDGERFCVSFADGIFGGLGAGGLFRSEFLDKEEFIDKIRDAVIGAFGSNAELLDERRDRADSGPTRILTIGYRNRDKEEMVREMRAFYEGNRLFVLEVDLKTADGKMPREAMKQRFFKSFRYE